MMKLNKINIGIITISLIINTIFLILTLLGKYNSNILVCLSLYVIVFIPSILTKLFRINISELVRFIFLIFIFIAQLLGSIIHLYDLISWFDSFVHFISGIVSSILSLQLLILFNKHDQKKKVFNLLFSISFTLMVASFWEIFEFSADRIFGYDAQRVLETGVYDTMKDIICALLGSLLFVVSYIYDFLFNKHRFVKFIYGIKK